MTQNTQCPQCGTEFPPTSNACPKCNLAIHKIMMGALSSNCIYKCNRCNLTIPYGTFYVLDEGGERIETDQKTILFTLKKTFGDNIPKELIASKTGFSWGCVCLDCLQLFHLDIRKDERVCPQCQSQKIQTVLESIMEQCPKCKEGTIEALVFAGCDE